MLLEENTERKMEDASEKEKQRDSQGKKMGTDR